jgi:hypothetical protein
MKPEELSIGVGSRGDPARPFVPARPRGLARVRLPGREEDSTTGSTGSTPAMGTTDAPTSGAPTTPTSTDTPATSTTDAPATTSTTDATTTTGPATSTGADTEDPVVTDCEAPPCFNVINRCAFPLWIHAVNNDQVVLQPDNVQLPPGGVQQYPVPAEWPAGRVNAYYAEPDANPEAHDKVEMTVTGGIMNYNITYVDYVALPSEMVAVGPECQPGPSSTRRSAVMSRETSCSPAARTTC